MKNWKIFQKSPYFPLFSHFCQICLFPIWRNSVKTATPYVDENSVFVYNTYFRCTCLAWLRTKYFCTFWIVIAHLDTKCSHPTSVDLEFGKPLNDSGPREIETKFNTNTHPIYLKHTETVLKRVIHMLLLFHRNTITQMWI